MKKILNLLVMFVLTASLACCGGGGSSPENIAPIAIAPSDFNAVETTKTRLDGSNSTDSDGSINSYSWIQISGDSVNLTNANVASSTFIAPDVDVDTPLTFELTVTDNEGATSVDSVIVTITPDQPPQVIVLDDFDAVELTSVSLDGSSSTDDISITSYFWEQTAGITVVLVNQNTSIASFTAPEVSSQALQMSFLLTVTDSNGATSSDSIDVTIIDTPDFITLSGNITYDHVSHNASNGLNYDNIAQSAIRGATVELLNANNSSILDTAVSDANGGYSFLVQTATSYIVRVKAELKKQDALPNWDFTVVDNTNVQALYVMDSATQSINTTSVVLNLNAPSGWTGSSYTEPRVAAPFAILDSVYEAKEKVVGVDSDVAMAALKLNWSINNVAVNGETSAGDIGTSHFNGTEIFILGDANGDTDEYDGHVIVHEWGHYFENSLSRSDSIGGSHSGSDKLDIRVAMGEGWGNALSGIVTDDPFYRDSFGASQGQGFDINVESNPAGTNKGWFSESSVQSLIYDVYDSDDDGSDTLSLGFEPIYRAMIAGEKNTLALTSIFSFANQLKLEVPDSASAIDTLLSSQDIIATDDFGTGQVNNGGDIRNIPVYKSLTPGGGSVEICSYGTNGQYNKLGNRKFLTMEITVAGSYTIDVVSQTAGADPDVYVYQQGELIFNSETNNNESVTQTMSTGFYVLDVYEFGNIQGTSMDTCIDVTLTAN